MLAEQKSFDQLALENTFDSLLPYQSQSDSDIPIWLHLSSLCRLKAAQALAQAESDLSKSEYSGLLNDYDISKTLSKSLLALNEAYKGFDLEELSHLDVLLLHKLARPPLTEIREAIKDCNDLSNEVVSATISEVNRINREQKKLNQQPLTETVFRQAADGSSYWATGNIYDQYEAGNAVEEMRSLEGKSPQTIVSEGVLLRKQIQETLIQSSEPVLNAHILQISENELTVKLNTDLPKIEFQGKELILIELDQVCKLETSVSLLEKKIPTDMSSYISLDSVQQQSIRQQQKMEDAIKLGESILDDLDPNTFKLIEALKKVAAGEQKFKLLRNVLWEVETECKEKAWKYLSKEEKTAVKNSLPLSWYKLYQAKTESVIRDFKEDLSGNFHLYTIGEVVPKIVSSTNLDLVLCSLYQKEGKLYKQS